MIDETGTPGSIPHTPAGYMRCDICADLVKAHEIAPCDQCGVLFCLDCGSSYLEDSGYRYCCMCVDSDQGDTEEDWGRFDDLP